MEAQTQEAPQRASLQALQQQRGTEASLPMIAPGFNSLQGYELMVRQAKALSSSTLVPTQYRQIIQKLDRDGNPKGPAIENANAIPNCMIALNMATRMNADPLMVMQNLVMVEGRPSWSSQWVIAQINNCGRFEPLRFDMVEKGREDIPYEYTEWDNSAPQGQQRQRKTRTVTIDNVECTAWTVPRGTKIPPNVNSIAEAKAAGLAVLKGPKVSVAIAVKEGWYTKTGSKWQTMPELMLHYRSGSFFGRLYAPELLMGIPSEDEVHDMGQLVQAADGSYGPATTDGADPMNPSVESLRRTAQAHADNGNEHPNANGGEHPSDGQKEHGEAAAPAPTPAPTPAPSPAAATAGQNDGTLFGRTD